MTSIFKHLSQIFLLFTTEKKRGKRIENSTQKSRVSLLMTTTGRRVERRRVQISWSGEASLEAMAEWYIASWKVSVALIYRRSTFAFSAVSIDRRSEPSVAASAVSSAIFGSSSDTSVSQTIERNSRAHQRRLASPEEGTGEETRAGRKIGRRRRGFIGGRIVGGRRWVAIGKGRGSPRDEDERRIAFNNWEISISTLQIRRIYLLWASLIQFPIPCRIMSPFQFHSMV